MTRLSMLTVSKAVGTYAGEDCSRARTGGESIEERAAHWGDGLQVLQVLTARAAVNGRVVTVQAQAGDVGCQRAGEHRAGRRPP